MINKTPIQEGNVNFLLCSMSDVCSPFTGSYKNFTRKTVRIPKKKKKNKELEMSRESTSSADWDDTERSINNPEAVYFSALQSLLLFHRVQLYCCCALHIWAEMTQNDTIRATFALMVMQNLLRRVWMLSSHLLQAAQSTRTEQFRRYDNHFKRTRPCCFIHHVGL